MKRIINICLVVILVGTTHAVTTTDNLLTNPSAGLGMTGWNASAQVSAVPSRVESAGTVLPLSGPNFFQMATIAGSSAYMEQTLDLGTLLGGLTSFTAGCYIQTELLPLLPIDANITANDYGEMVVEFKDVNDVSLATFSTGPIGNPVIGGNSYLLFVEANDIPSEANSVVYRLNGTLVDGSFVNVFYDDLSFTVDLEATITKIMPEDANLGDYITITLDIENPYDHNIIVRDTIPGGMHYLPMTLEVDGNAVVPLAGFTEIATVIAPGQHTVNFDVQVVEVMATDVNMTNCAGLYDSNGILLSSDCAAITLHPYEGFTKVIVDWWGTADPCANETYVPIHTDIHWLMAITVENIAGDSIIDMNDIIVQDRLGGDLELDDVNSISQGLLDQSRKKGKTLKQFLTWDVGDVNDANNAELVLEISTDVNPGQQKRKKVPPINEYTEPGVHYLNSGAVLKFVDPQTGFQLSAHTPPIMVTAY